MVDNSGTPDDLVPQIDRLWTWLQALPQLPPDYEPITPTPKGPADDAAAAADGEPAEG